MRSFHIYGDVVSLSMGCISDGGIDARNVTADMLVSCWNGNEKIDWDRLAFFSAELLAFYCACKEEMEKKDVLQWLFISFVARDCIEHACSSWEFVLKPILQVLTVERTSPMHFLNKMKKSFFLNFRRKQRIESYLEIHPIEMVTKEDFLRLLLRMSNCEK